MSFLGLTMKGLGSAIGGGITSGLTSAVSGAIGGIFGGIKAKKQHKRNKELMALQNQYEIDRMNLQANINKQQAEYSQGLAKEMYDYTFQNEAEYNDPKNQKARMEAAGLNPALMYGSSAAGAGGVAEGSTGGAGAAGPVTAIQPMGLQVALQAESQKAQIELAQSQAAKNYAEAGKITGIDTEKGRQDIKESESKVLLNEAEAAKTWEELKETTEKIKGLELDNFVKENTKEAEVNTVAQSLNILYQQAAMNVISAEKGEKENELLKKEIEAFDKKIDALIQEVENGKITAGAAAKQAENAAKALEQQAPKTNSEVIKNYTEVATGVATGLLLLVPGAKKIKSAIKWVKSKF